MGAIIFLIVAENKKSFIAYSDWKSTFDELPNEDAGILIKHIFAYVNDENPQTDSVLIKAVFANIKSSLKRDLFRWESQLIQRSNAGKRSAEVRATKSNDRSTTVNEPQRNPTDSVNVSVNVNETNKDNIELLKQRSIIFSESIKPFVETYGKEMCNNFYRHWSEPTPSKKKMKFELQKTWDVSRRLITWEKNSHAFDKNPKEIKQTTEFKPAPKL